MHLPIGDKLPLASRGTANGDGADASRAKDPLSANDVDSPDTILFSRLLPTDNEDSNGTGDSRFDILLLTWLLVLYRYSGGSLGEFTWGYKQRNNASSASKQFGVSPSEVGLDASASAPDVIEAIRSLRNCEGWPSNLLSSQNTLFFNNGTPSDKDTVSSSDVSRSLYYYRLSRS